ncbi:MAG: GNAT family N-acetyltransferase [Burkholderiales bacterium]|nr:GNAT family N-acetyltransferase [Burkholderiales bacterium]
MSNPRNFSALQLQTERLQLRPLVESDATALLEIFSDPRVMRYWSTGTWQSISEAEALIARDQAGMASDEYLRLGLVRQQDSQLLGHCCLFNFNDQCRRAEIGYGMAYSAWGHGYMHEALTRVVEYAFTELALNRIEADIDPRNERSAHSLERLGFQREGFLRERWIVDGEVSDSALYGLLKAEWRVEG